MEALGAIIGPLTEGMASAAQYQASKHERNVAWRRQQAWELMAPSLRVEGLRNAGLNPILAATQGMTHGGTNVAQGRPGDLPRFSSADIGKGVSAARQIKTQNAAVREAEARAAGTEAEARLRAKDLDLQNKYGDLERTNGIVNMLLGNSATQQNIMESRARTNAMGTGSWRDRESMRLQEKAMSMGKIGIPGFLDMKFDTRDFRSGLSEAFESSGKSVRDSSRDFDAGLDAAGERAWKDVKKFGAYWND